MSRNKPWLRNILPFGAPRYVTGRGHCDRTLSDTNKLARGRAGAGELRYGNAIYGARCELASVSARHWMGEGVGAGLAVLAKRASRLRNDQLLVWSA